MAAAIAALEIAEKRLVNRKSIPSKLGILGITVAMRRAHQPPLKPRATRWRRPKGAPLRA